MEGTTETIVTRCCIAGGGPAGMMLGFLLARAGIDVIVLEKHKDFFRDFRGDTIHPSTLQLMHELGLLDDFLKVPHQEVEKISAQFDDVEVPIADFSHLKTAKQVLAFMPQWDFLDFLKQHATAFPSFRLILEADVYDLVRNDNCVTGVVAHTPSGTLQVNAALVVGTDGRHSTVREKAGLQVITTGAPIDVVWFRLSKQQGDPLASFGRFHHGRIMVLIDRGDYWQCAYVIKKGDFDAIKRDGVAAFGKQLREVSPFLGARVGEITGWEDVSLLSVAIDHLLTWYAPGLLCIGDAAHAMSPVGGVGINLAIQDAVAAANILYKALRKTGPVPVAILRKVQRRRALPMRVIQRLQVFIQNGMINKYNEGEKSGMPVFFRLFKRFPFLRRIPARIIGMGIRPEHIKAATM